MEIKLNYFPLPFSDFISFINRCLFIFVFFFSTNIKYLLGGKNNLKQIHENCMAITHITQ